MSGDGVQGLAPLGRGEELDFGRDEPRVVPAQARASGAFTHGVVASHGVPLPQRVLVRQLALLEGLDQDGRLLVQFFGAAGRRRYLQEKQQNICMVVFFSDPNYDPMSAGSLDLCEEL